MTILWLGSGHIGANNLFPNVMQIEKYLFSFWFAVYPETRIYRWDGLALRGRKANNCQEGGTLQSNQQILTSYYPNSSWPYNEAASWVAASGKTRPGRQKSKCFNAYVGWGFVFFCDRIPYPLRWPLPNSNARFVGVMSMLRIFTVSRWHLQLWRGIKTKRNSSSRLQSPWVAQ